MTIYEELCNPFYAIPKIRASGEDIPAVSFALQVGDIWRIHQVFFSGEIKPFMGVAHCLNELECIEWCCTQTSAWYGWVPTTVAQKLSEMLLANQIQEATWLIEMKHLPLDAFPVQFVEWLCRFVSDHQADQDAQGEPRTNYTLETIKDLYETYRNIG